MQPLAVDLRLLSELRGPALRLLPGRGLMARVMEADGTGRGLLNIAGAVIEAQLPRHLRAGEQVRLVVRELDTQRVVLELPQEQAPPAPPAPPPVPLPGGGTVRWEPEPEPEAGAGGNDSGHRLALRYEAPALGALDLRFELDAGALRVSIAAPAGAPVQLARDRAQELRSALSATGERPVTVTVTSRREPLDLYA